MAKAGGKRGTAKARMRPAPVLAVDPTAWPANRTERRAIGELLPYANNARTHSAGQVEQIAGAIAKWGWTAPVLIDEGGMILAGHGRVLAAKRLGLVEVPVMVAQGWSDAQKRAYILADNKIAENAGWDKELLGLELAALKGLPEFGDLGAIGFSDIELKRLLGEPEREEDDEGDQVVEASDGPAISMPGDLWLLGEHRLLCGSCTDEAAVAQLMDGDRAALLFTSPPYSTQRNYGAAIADWDALMRGAFRGCPVSDSGQILVNLGLVHSEGEWTPYWDLWIEFMRAEGWRRFGLYCWDQGPGLPGDWSGRLAPSFELVFHFNRTARKPNKIVPAVYAGTERSKPPTGLRSQDGKMSGWTHGLAATQDMKIPDSVLRIMRHKARGIECQHPAVFPIALPEFVMSAYSDQGEVVYDPFSGSGTTIIAAEMTGRRARAIELEPAYVDVAVRRWEGFTGKCAILAAGDLSMADAAAQRRPLQAA